MVTLVTHDNVQFKVDKAVIERSVLIRDMLHDTEESDKPIPLPNVSSAVLEKVLTYCMHHRNEPLPKTISEPDLRPVAERTAKVGEWDSKLLDTDQSTQIQIIVAAHYLDIYPLFDASCKVVADQIRGMTPDQLRKHFGIVNDFTPEEEDRIRRDNDWANDQ